MTAAKKTEKPKRLTPTPEVLRELYLLSGNNCAMPNCKHVIIDRAGVVVGHICHIEAAMPDGPRFNESQSNEERRSLANLVLMCAGHHAQIDSKKHEKEYTVSKLKRIKEVHEKNFKGLDNSLEQAFQNPYVDATDSLSPTVPSYFAKLEKLLPDCEVRTSDARFRSKQIREYVNKLSKVPDNERQFMASVIRRALKLNANNDIICVHVNDVKGSFGIGHERIKELGDALNRYGVGSIDLASVGEQDDWHVVINHPSEFVAWFDIANFCKASGSDLDDFVLRLNFGLLD